MIAHKTSGSRPSARRHERRALQTTAHKDFAPLGSFVSATPRMQLLGALKRLKPQLNLRLRMLEQIADACRYGVEIETHELQQRHLIDLWLGVKGALTTAFPENRPGGIRSLQP